LKSRLAVSIIISILIASALAASYTGYTTVLANPTHGFTLTLTGTAQDRQNHVSVKVTFTVTGTADGKLKTVVTLHVKGEADVFVSTYGTFDVSHGNGQLILRCRYIALCIWLTPEYGGKTTLWCMSGRTGTLHGQTLEVSLRAEDVILPMKGSPRLWELSLKGTITPVY
jgi:hypothetical protein